MKQLRWIWILGAAAVLLTVLFIIVDRRSKQNEEKAQIGAPKQLLHIDPDVVTDIELNNEDGKIVFSWLDGTWKITEGEQFNVNVYAVNAICNYICNLDSLKTVAFDCDKTDVYGFTDPTTLKVYTTDTDKEHPYILYVGDATPTYDSYYAMVDGSNDVYTIDYNSGTVFCSDRNSLKNRYLFDTSSALVNYYKVEKDGKTVIECKRGSDFYWTMKQPADFELSNAEMNDLMDVIVRVQIAAFVEDNPEDLAKYGLDHPQSKLTLEGVFNESVKKQEIWFGDMASSDENETQIYGYYSDSKQVFRINRAEISFMNDDIKELMYPFCVQPDIEKLKSVEIDMGEVYDLHETLYLDYANDKYKLGDKDISALDDEDIMQRYQTFYRSIAELRFSEVQLDSKPDPEKEPAIRIVYTENDGKQLKLDFIEKEPNNYYLVKDGTYTGLTVRLNCFTGAGSVTDRYKLLTEKLK
ncbi:MAG: DUF4340 domain-containing protein [Oscillospiraceae bacterium]|nr:DUF4340 domain-containing protein [Oscillospiraceae bacterium]MBQ5338154.1 DUF4340 domain-containing protein [Oscillospiraceae bacterium]